jgi:transposase
LACIRFAIVTLGMSKRGDAYLRTLLIHGARSAILAARRKSQNTNVSLANLLTAGTRISLR